MFKRIITKIFERQAAKLLAKSQPRIVVIVGSVGKTSTKKAIVSVLEQHFRVVYNEGSYNTELPVPLTLLRLELPPSLFNPLAWVSLFIKSQNFIQRGADYDVAVLELGTDTPGDMAKFASYIQPDVTVITAIADEHMENFKTLEAVAREEFLITSNSKVAIINRDDTELIYDHLNRAATIFSYGLTKDCDFQFLKDKFSLEYGYDGRFFGEGFGELSAQLRVVGEHNIKPAVAAVAVATQLQMPHDKIAKGVELIEPVPGRMNLLAGAERSIVLDDSYNSSPISVKAALKTLYGMQASGRIAILGSMNELGETSQASHRSVGEHCDSKYLDWVVTVGDEAEKYLAPAAKAAGCKVESFDSPYEAGAFVRGKLQPGTLVLVKGSQNRIFTEEATKLLLADSNDEKQLVRQSPKWLQIKHDYFSQL